MRQRISVVAADVSPDLRQARISISVRKSNDEDDSNSNAAVDKRRAFAWLVRNTKAIRHTLAQQLSHIKSCPNLTFVQVDVAAAVDVMYLIDKVSKGNYKREQEDLLPYDNGDDDDEWEEEDDDFF